MSEPDTSSNSHSSSFDSSNSFYSTTDTNSHSSLPLLESPNPLVQDEEFLDPQYRAIVESRIQMTLKEIANDANFGVIVDLPTVRVETSGNPQTPFCFRASAHFPANSATSAFALFADIQQRATWDAMCQDIRVIQTIDPLTFIYHLRLKSTWPTTPRDSLMLAAFRKLKDGRFISVAWSIEDPAACPEDNSHIRMETRISANLFTPLTPTSFQLTQLIDADPKGSIPAYLIKSMSAKSFPATIERIKSAIDPQMSGFYNNLIERENDTFDSHVSSSTNATSDATGSDHQLREIQKQLTQIESQLHQQQSQQSQLSFWAPITLSTISVLLLLNLNLRKK